jgi:bacillithiol system protein YtxJ
MGFLDLFKSQSDIAKEELKEIPWHMLTSHEQLDELEKESYKLPVVIFKYSTRCGTNRMVLKLFEKQYSLSEDAMRLYFLDIIQYREVSREIATRFRVQHESPQLLIIKNGNVVDHNSHQGIATVQLERYL